MIYREREPFYYVTVEENFSFVRKHRQSYHENSGFHHFMDVLLLKSR